MKSKMKKIILMVSMLTPLLTLGQLDVKPNYTAPYFQGDVRVADTLQVDSVITTAEVSTSVLVLKSQNYKIELVGNSLTGNHTATLQDTSGVVAYMHDLEGFSTGGGGSSVDNIMIVTEATTVDANVDVLFVNSGDVGYTIELPNPSVGARIEVVNTGGVGVVTLTTSLGDINHQGSAVLFQPLYTGVGQVQQLRSDGNNWYLGN